MKEHYSIKRLGKLRSVFNAIFSRTATTKHALPKMRTSVDTIVREGQAVQAGIRHIEEGHFDSQALSDEFAHLTTFAINLPSTIEGDGSFWGYALNLVGDDAFKEGIEFCSVTRIERLIRIANEVLLVKLEIQQAKETLAEEKGQKLE